MPMSRRLALLTPLLLFALTACDFQPMSSARLIAAVPQGLSASDVTRVKLTNSGDTLTYAWTATGGSFSATSTNSTSWTAPASPGTGTIGRP